MSQAQRHAARLEEVRALLVEELGLSVHPAVVQPDTPLLVTGLALESIDVLEAYVAASQSMLILLGHPAYFGSQNCLREAKMAKAQSLPLVLVHDADPTKGGAPLADLKAVRFTVGELKEAGFSDGRLKEAGFTASEFKESDVSAVDLRAVGFTMEALKGAIDAAVKAGVGKSKFDEPGRAALKVAKERLAAFDEQHRLSERAKAKYAELDAKHDLTTKAAVAKAKGMKAVICKCAFANFILLQFLKQSAFLT